MNKQITLGLYCSSTIRRQCSAELFGMDELGQALQAIYQARAWTPDKIRIKAIDMMSL